MLEVPWTMREISTSQDVNNGYGNRTKPELENWSFHRYVSRSSLPVQTPTLFTPRVLEYHEALDDDSLVSSHVCIVCL